MNSKSLKILISGSYGTGNVGDEVILACILDQLKKHDVTVLSQGPDYTTKNFNGIRVVDQTPGWMLSRIVKDILRFRFGELYKRLVFLNELRQADIFWLGGGGLLAEMVPAVLRYYIQQMKLARFFNCKVVTFAVGVGPLKTIEGKELLKKTLMDAVSGISVRDTDSEKLLRGIGVSKEIQVIPDPAFLYIRNVPLIPNRVVLNFYPVFMDQRIWPDQLYRLEKLKNTLLEITRHLISDLNYEVVYLPYGTQVDKNFALEMKDKFLELNPAFGNRLSVFEGKSYGEITDVLVSAKWSLTMRFHAGLISMVNKRPSICIDQQFKSERILQQFDLNELLVSLPDNHHKVGNKDIDTEKLKGQIKWLEDNYSSCCDKIAKNVTSSQRELSHFYSKLEQFI